MRLHAVCYYRSKSEEWTGSWRDVDYKARNLVKAVKRQAFNGSSSFPTTSGAWVTVDNTAHGQATALNLAASRLVALIAEAGYKDVAVIPIPSSTHTQPGAEFTGSRLAAAIQARNPNFRSTPVLYLAKALPKSSGGGGRDTHLIESCLRATDQIKAISQAVLLDDVYTSGAHMRAVVRFVTRYGISISDGFVVGRTAWQKPDNMFACASEEVYTEGGNLSFFS